MHLSVLVVLVLTILPRSAATASKQARELADATNRYRRQAGLQPIPVNPNLETVACMHVQDLDANHPHKGSCNLHSWSSIGGATPCCYTGAQHGQCMWSKPKELSSYSSNGFEIAAAGTHTPEAAISAWKASPEHNNVVLNRGDWSRIWKAMGACMQNGYAVVWFGHEAA